MAEELKIALIQSSLLWENPKENRKYFAEKIDLISEDVDLIILPEMFTTGFTMHPENIAKNEGENTVTWMSKIAKEKNLAITGSIPYFSDGKYTNRLFFVYPDGKKLWYDKRHTFTLAGEDKIYAAGTEKLVLDYKGFKICPLICYDLRFPVWARNVDDYDVLLYVANWPKPRITAWDTLLKARAIENMSYCIGVNRIGDDEVGHNYPGHSAVYDPLGEQIVFSEKEEVIETTLFKTKVTVIREKLKFLNDRDTFTVSR